MNTTERAALLPSSSLFDEVHAAVNPRTIEILERRRRTAVVRRRGWLVRRALLGADVAGLLLAFLVAHLLFNRPDVPGSIGAAGEYLALLLTLPLWVVVAKVYGLYDNDEERADHSTADEFVSVFHLVTVGTWLVFAAAIVSGLARPDLPKLLGFWALAIALVSLSRSVARAVCRRSLTYLQNTVIVGAGEIGQLVAHKFLQHPEYGINLVGFVDAEPREPRPDVEEVPLLGPPERLPALVRLFDVERVVIAFSSAPHEHQLELVRSLKDLDVQVDIVPRLFEVVGPNVGVHTVEGLPLLGLPSLRLSRSSELLKRAIDVTLSLAGLIVLAPVLAAIAVRVKLDSPGPVFFRQVRMGRGDRPFRIFKFRTMVEGADIHKWELAHLNVHARPGGDPRMFKIPDDPRTTAFGRFLRRWSLDELPQLLNVLSGEMSLVGPRPLVLDEDQYVERWGRQRLNLKPGITGPWQVLGASNIPFEEMVKLDYLYVTGWSLLTDLKLVFRTLPAVLRTRTAY